MAFADTTCYKDHGDIYADCVVSTTLQLITCVPAGYTRWQHFLIFQLLSFIIHDHNYRRSQRTQHLTSVATAGCHSFRKCNRL